jgi:hypothetical protein
MNGAQLILLNKIIQKKIKIGVLWDVTPYGSYKSHTA